MFFPRIILVLLANLKSRKNKNITRAVNSNSKIINSNNFNSKTFLFLASNIEWTMNDLLQLKKPLSSAKINIRDTTTGNINQQQAVETENGSAAVKKFTNHHKRPSISYEISSKRAKGHDTTIKTTPQLLQQLIATTGTNGQKSRQKTAIQNIKIENRWTPPPNVVEEKQQQKPAATNSVLMNLLVSGCDVSAGYYTCLPRPKVAKA